MGLPWDCPKRTCGFSHTDPVKIIIHVEQYHELSERAMEPQDLEVNKLAAERLDLTDE